MDYRDQERRRRSNEETRGIKSCAEGAASAKSELRQRFSKQRHWVINYTTHAYDNAAELGPALHRELMEQTEQKQMFMNQEMTEREAQAYEAKKNEFMSFVIQEEKGTRAMFEEIAKWAFNRELYVRRKEERRIARRQSILEMGGNIKASKRKVLSTTSSTATAVIKEDEELDDDPAEVAELEMPSSEEEEEEEEDDDDDSEEDDPLQEEKKESFFGANLPRVKADSIMSFLKCAQVYISHDHHRNQVIDEVEKLREARDAEHRREGAMFNAKLEAEQVMGLTKAEMESKINAYSARQQSEVERTDREWFARIPPRRPPGVPQTERISRQVFNLISGIHWLNVIYDKEVFYHSLKNLPTQEAGVFARDELIQFATIISEVDPLVTKAQNRILKEKEEEALALGLRSEAEKRSSKVAR